MDHLSESINSIQGVCINEMNCHFFQIRTEKAKETLTKRAKTIRKALLAKIYNSSCKKVTHIQTKYDNLKTKMTTDPETEKELVEMQGILESYEERLEELDKEVNETESYIDLLTKYGTHYGRKDVIKFWFLKVMPMEVKRDSKKGSKIAQKHETEFLKKLGEEKEQF